MKHEALKELSLIIKESREHLRETLLQEWIQKWVYCTEQTQYVINKSILNTEEIDFVWYKIAEQCAEDLIEHQIAESNSTNNTFTCKVWALRKPYAKFKEDSKNRKKSG